MKFIQLTQEGKTFTIEVEVRFLFFFKLRKKFKTIDCHIKNKYWTWVKLPNETRIWDSDSFHLDALCRNNLDKLCNGGG